MIAFEIEKGNATVRIHDEFCNTSAEQKMQHVNRVITDYYKRRYTSMQEMANKPQIEQAPRI